MNHFKKIIAVFAFATMGFLPAAQAEKWVFASFDVPPHACEKCPGQGALVTAIREALKEKGIEIEVQFFPYIRAQKEAASAKFVGYFPEWPSDLPAGEFSASGTILESPVVFITPKAKPLVWKSLADLKGKMIGVVNGYSYGPDFTKAQTDKVFQVEAAADEATNLRKVSGGRFDATVMDSNNAKAILKTEKIDPNTVEIQSQIVTTIPNVVGFNKGGAKADEKLKLFNEVVTKAKIEEIFKKYMKDNY